MKGHPEKEPSARLIASLEPWLANVVIIGGWAYRLSRLHPNAQQVMYIPLMTLGTDAAPPLDCGSNWRIDRLDSYAA